MSLPAGHRLAHYEILKPIGKGGMGEVYRARDTKLDRDVAIKVLPEKFAKDKERLARFEREAKLLASLNHPNIASIYGLEESDGLKALVLELVEGPTLAERIADGPISVEETLAIAKQVVEALEAGHEAGVIHRDLKPANVKVKEDGTIKVLDYGLAKALEGEASSGTDSRLSQSPTLTRHGTQVGVILGTAAYMSPEQAKGKRVDRRTDIWAFGAVVFEMLSGKRAFAGEDVSDTLAAVLRAEPDLDVLPAETPESLLLVLRLCLSKDVTERFQSIGDVRLALKGAFETTTIQQGAVSLPVGWRPSMGTATAAALMLSVITGVAAWSVMYREPTPRPVIRFSLPLPPGETLTAAGRHAVALSSDGTRLVYSANDQLYLRAMDQMEATPVRGTEGGTSPFFSPDGEWIGFYAAGGQLKKVAVSGGAPVTLCEAQTSLGARWGADDTIIFGQRGTGILQVSADGGTPEVLIPLTGTEVFGPQVLPGDKAVLFTLGHGGMSWDDAQIVVHSFATGERNVLIEGGRDARYVPTGHLVYVLDGTLLAVPFDVDALEVTGGPIPMAEGVMTAGLRSGAAHFSVSDTGALVYVTGGDPAERTLVWVDRDGREETLAAEPRAYRQPRISPDGGRVAVVLRDPEQDIWIWDFARETLTPLTFAPRSDFYPVWTPDGRRVAFASNRDGKFNLFWKAADGTGTVERLTESENLQFPYAFTPDGRQLVFSEFGEQSVTLGVLSLEGSSEPLLENEFDEQNGEISPDGLWLAYQSNASGQDEIYVRPFPNVDDGRWPISSGGGTRPLWARDGQELFYLAAGAMMAVDVQTEPSFAPGNAEEVFAVRGYFVESVGRTYDISRDGERFLMIKEDAGGESTEFIFVQNWFEELKRLVPTDN